MPRRQSLRLAESPDIQGDKAIPTLKASAFNRAKQVCAVPTPVAAVNWRGGMLPRLM